MHILLGFVLAVQDLRGVEGPRARTIVNFRLEEFFDEARADGVTEAAHPYTLVVPYPDGQFSFNTRCHWLRREGPRVPQDPEDEPPSIPEIVPLPGTPFFRGGGVGGKLQLPTSLASPTLEAISLIDARVVEFDEVDVGTLPGVRLGTTFSAGGIKCLFFAEYVGGTFTATSHTSGTTVTQGGQEVPPGHHGDPPPIQTPQEFEVVDTWKLAGDIWFLEVGVSPVLMSLTTGDGAWRADLALAMGAYLGGLTGMEVARSGSVGETIDVADESLLGGFVGPTAHARVQMASGVGLGVFGEWWRFMGDATGWTKSVGFGLELDF